MSIIFWHVIGDIMEEHMNSLMTLYINCKLVEIHDKVGERINAGIITIGNIDNENFESNMADEYSNRELSLEDFVPN